MQAGARTESGFTLVELLLAVMLMSLLLALAYGGLKAATQATNQGQVVLEESGRLRLTHQFLRRQLNQMLPLQWADIPDEDAELSMFQGSAAYIQFVAPMPGYLGSGGPHVQRLELVEGEQGLQLQFSHALWQGFSDERLYDRDPVVLLKGLEFAGFEFLERDEEGELLGWTPEWQQPEILPEAVRLDIDFGSDSAVNWPLLSTGIRVDSLAIRQSSRDRPYNEVIQDMIQRPRDSGQ
jgi:general secretion pathway protein J